MLKEEINKALEVLKAGGIILYPTDINWSLGCDATNSESVAKLFLIKSQVQDQDLAILLDTENKLQSYISEVPDIAYDLIEYSEKPITIIYSGAKNLASNLINPDGSIGIRIPKHDFCQQLIQRFRKPIVATAAHLNDKSTALKFSEISENIIDKADYVVNLEQDSNEIKQLPTIMKLEADGRFELIRK
ncbi:L-threonylcarbamoyladenylate synthase [Pelobium sp.]|nr:L-threonylcarbamoyladenylate synthase [Pelobium sp.]MDA9555258.1 L-threonylcarbamoyladenylate synthase [Pelobium sp.]